MNHAITLGDLIHYTLFMAFLVSLVVDVYAWISLAAASVSKIPFVDSMRLPAFIAINLLPIGLFAAWWFT